MQAEAKRQWKLNEALSLALLSPVASLYAPVAPPSGPQGLPHLAWRPDRAFHTSALCASALDSITLPYRLHRPSPSSPLGCATGTQTSGLPPPCLLPAALHACFPPPCLLPATMPASRHYACFRLLCMPASRHYACFPPLCLLPAALHGCFPPHVVACHAVHAVPAGTTCARHPATLLTAIPGHAPPGLSMQHLAKWSNNIYACSGHCHPASRDRTYCLLVWLLIRWKP